ncbi:MAG: hypothetical protein KKA76_09415 [Proteobacteria bacterium]|nr:hypothetical protein [Pseudomonadota bacterium]
MEIEEIARIAYEINIALLKSYGDRSQPPWEIAPQWLKDNTINGVKFHLANPDASPSYSHDLWVEELTADGWVYGPIQIDAIKVHPLLMPFDEIPQSHRTKDWVFRQVVRSLSVKC